jgi:hypothetical protein
MAVSALMSVQAILGVRQSGVLPRNFKLHQHTDRTPRLRDRLPLRAIYATITVHLLFGGRPHRSHRSHSPQTKSDPWRDRAISAASLEMTA